MTAFDILPIGACFAREVRGIRLWEMPESGTIAAVRNAWRACGVLVFRRQALSEDELVAFTTHFGRPDIIVRTEWQSRNRPEVVQVTNMKNQAGESIGGLGAGELEWHSDQSYVAHPATGAMLYMVEMPREGGLTSWANLQLAWAALPAATQRRIAGLRVVYDYLKRQSRYDDERPMSAELRRRTPPVTHPLVNVHPVTGAHSLYLDPSTAVGIECMEDAEGRALIAELAAHATQPAFVYRHEWQIGDVVLWDNGITMHRRDPFDARLNRLLKRTTFRVPPEYHVVPAPERAA